MTTDRTNDQTDLDNTPAPLVEIDVARIFPSRDDAEAYVARLELANVAILPHPEGSVIGHYEAGTGRLLGYEA